MRVRLVPALAALLLLGSALAGCVTPSDVGTSSTTDPGPETDVDLSKEDVTEGLREMLQARSEPRTMESNLTVNVVLVGMDPSLVDEDAVRDQLPKRYSPNVDFSKPRTGALRSGQQLDLSYELHGAPTAFAEDLFANYTKWAREHDYTDRGGPGPSFLERYDEMYDLGRADGTEHLVNATAVEDWMHEHRDAYGLDFQEPEATVFFLDSWTNHDLWKDDYYRYEFRQDNGAPGPENQAIRAWGGTHDFLFMDYSAAPNDVRDDQTGVDRVAVFGGISQRVPAAEGTAYNDPPTWHYDGNEAEIGKGPLRHTVKLGDRIAYATDVAVNLRLVGDYAFRPIYSERYHVNVHLWHDGRSAMPTENMAQYIDRDHLESSLQQEVPWANLTVSLDTYVAPEDDPGMAQALDTAKAEGGATYIPIAPVWKHVEANEEKYDNAPEDGFSVNALMFLLEGHYAFALPLVVGGIAFSGPDGTAWGTISSVNDAGYVGDGRDMHDTAQDLVGINAHEVGHFFGLPHAHDGSRRTDDGYEPFLSHTWSSTRTIMSYRTEPDTADRFHVEELARAHTRENLRQTTRNAESVYRALDARGAAGTPTGILEDLEAADQARAQAQAAFDEGRYRDAVDAAIDARKASERALEAAQVDEETVRVAAWTNEGVNSAGARWSAVSFEPSVTPTGVQFDYRKVEITPDVEEVTVRAHWNNTPSSWGDFFVGWSRSQKEPFVNAGPVPYGSPVSLGGGIHDPVAEGPQDGETTRSFTLDIDNFPIFRETGTLYMGAGTQGRAVDGAYKTEILVTYRDHGDDTVPDPVDGVQEDAGRLVERDVEVSEGSAVDGPQRAADGDGPDQPLPEFLAATGPP
jgi:hypothetical protein